MNVEEKIIALIFFLILFSLFLHILKSDEYQKQEIEVGADSWDGSSYEQQFHKATGGMLYHVCASYEVENTKCFPVAQGTVMTCECIKTKGKPYRIKE